MSLLRASACAVTPKCVRRPLTSLVAGAAIGVSVACGGGASVGPPGSPVAAAEAAATCDYTVRVGSDLALSVDATFGAEGPMVLAVDDAALDYVEGVSLQDGAEKKSVARQEDGYRVFCPKTCRVAYRFRLREAATRLADVDTAILLGGAAIASPSTWLLHPSTRRGRYTFRVETAPGVGFVSGLRPGKGAAPDAYEGDLSGIDESPYAAFGGVKRIRVAPGLDVAVVSGLSLTDSDVTAWVASERSAVGAYLGHFPDDHVTVFVAPGTSEVNRGKTLGGGGAAILVRVGTKTTARSLADDWVVAHELVHVGFPSIGYEHAWFAEGLATYVEPVARARTGAVSVEKFWTDLVEGLPQGIARAADKGLEGSEEWGRVYWGGAFYFLMADLTIRERTSGARSLDDAIRAVAETGANVETRWTLERVIEAGDRRTGTTVLHELYEQYGLAPGKADLAALWVKLGIRQGQRSGPLAFDNKAPWASFRDAITADHPKERPPL